jgi:hypothetical protein
MAMSLRTKGTRTRKNKHERKRKGKGREDEADGVKNICTVLVTTRYKCGISLGTNVSPSFLPRTCIGTITGTNERFSTSEAKSNPRSFPIPSRKRALPAASVSDSKQEKSSPSSICDRCLQLTTTKIMAPKPDGKG